MAEDELVCLRDASGKVPFEALDALVAAALARPELVDQLRERYGDLYVGDAYEGDTFEAVYLPYVLTEVARRGTAEQRQAICEDLMGELECRAEDEDWSAREFLFNCLRTLPVNDIAPFLFEALDRCHQRDEAAESLSYWELLGPISNEGTEEHRTRLQETAMRALEAAVKGEKSSSGAEFFCTRLADLHCTAALPKLAELEKRIRRTAGNPIEAIDANGVRYAIDVLQGKEPAYESRAPQPLRELVQEEVDSNAQWYEERKQPGYGEESETTGEFDAGEEPEPMMPAYSDQTLTALGFDAGQGPFVKEGKTGRNDPCPCGSGKKFKKCCGK